MFRGSFQGSWLQSYSLHTLFPEGESRERHSHLCATLGLGEINKQTNKPVSGVMTCKHMKSIWKLLFNEGLKATRPHCNVTGRGIWATCIRGFPVWILFWVAWKIYPALGCLVGSAFSFLGSHVLGSFLVAPPDTNQFISPRGAQEDLMIIALCETILKSPELHHLPWN